MVNEASERSLAMLAFFIVSLFVLCNHFSNAMPWDIGFFGQALEHTARSLWFVASNPQYRASIHGHDLVGTLATNPSALFDAQCDVAVLSGSFFHH